MNTSRRSNSGSPNRDPITGAPGAHPIGTGVGALAGAAAAGAAIGTVAGPLGTLAGAAAGAIAGGLAGKGVAEAVDPTREDAYWRENFSTQSYVADGSSYDDYGPAYGFGVDAVSRYPGRSFDQVETEMSLQWSEHRGASRLPWQGARDAARDAWTRARGPL